MDRPSCSTRRPAAGRSLVWVLPLAGGAVAVGWLVVLFVRRRRSTAVGRRSRRGPGGLPRSPGGDLSTVGLAEQRRFLDPVAGRRRRRVPGRRPVRPRLPGPAPPGPGPAGHRWGPDGRGRRRHRGRRRDPAAGATLTAVAPAAPATRLPWHQRRSGDPCRGRPGAGGAGGSWSGRWPLSPPPSIVTVPLFASDRLPGQSVTGSVATTPAQQAAEILAQAAADENQGQLGQAAQLYQSVLDTHPDNEVALAQLGWLEYQTGQQGTERVADGRRPGQARPGRASSTRATTPSTSIWARCCLQQDDDPAGAVDPVPAVPGRPSAGRRWSARPPPSSGRPSPQAGEPVPAGIARRADAQSGLRGRAPPCRRWSGR